MPQNPPSSLSQGPRILLLPGTTILLRLKYDIFVRNRHYTEQIQGTEKDWLPAKGSPSAAALSRGSVLLWLFTTF